MDIADRHDPSGPRRFGLSVYCGCGVGGALLAGIGRLDHVCGRAGVAERTIVEGLNSRAGREEAEKDDESRTFHVRAPSEEGDTIARVNGGTNLRVEAPMNDRVR